MRAVRFPLRIKLGAAAAALSAIPLAVAASLVPLPDELRAGRGERYGMCVVDGALGAGALVALLFAA